MTLHAETHTPRPDPSAIASYVDVVFGYLEGIVPIRMFPEKGTDHRSSVTPFVRAKAGLADEIVRHAASAAQRSLGVYVVPGVVDAPGKAGAEDVRATCVVLVDLDQGDIDAAEAHLAHHLGPATLVVASGGLTAEGQRKRHLYWRLTEAATGDELEAVRSMRKEIARKTGGDPSFGSLHQPVRVAGTIHGKHGVKTPAKILSRTEREYELVDLGAAVGDMPSLVTANSSEFPIARDGAGPTGPSARDLMHTRIREGGVDGTTRFAALSAVIGHWVRQARLGNLGLREARRAVEEHNATLIDPPWEPRRLNREFDALLARDRKQHPEVWRLREVDGATDPHPELDRLQPEALSEDALAARFTARHADAWRYLGDWKQWFKWDGCVWRLDRSGEVFEKVRLVCRDARNLGATEREARRIGSDKTIRSVERIARSAPEHATEVDAFDADPMVLNTPGGIIDLATGEISDCAPDALMMRITRARLGGTCPTWLAFLARVTGGDQDVVSYLQRVAGYCLTGDTSEHAFFFLHGEGANGKSVFLRTIAFVLGDYARAAALDAFMTSKGDRHSVDLAVLRGARFVIVTETEQGRSWAESRIKSITGGDVIDARFLYGQPFEFRPAFKLMIAGNHRPAFSNNTEAMRRRLHLVPFSEVIPPSERDKRLEEKLRTEADGILAWMLEGCAKWRLAGLAPPRRVLDASEDYFHSGDAVGQWIEEACRLEATVRASSAQLYDSWRVWAESAGVPAGSKRDLGEALRSRGFTAWKTKRARGWAGIAPWPRGVAEKCEAAE